MGVDLKNPKLGEQLLSDQNGDLARAVWKAYFWEHSRRFRPVLDWWADPDEVAIEPRQAVDEASKLMDKEIIERLERGYSDIDSGEDTRQTFIYVLEAARQVSTILGRASSFQPRRGQPATMRPIAVRAFVIRKFNPHPKKKGESSVRWAKLTDLLLLENGKCPRRISDAVGQRSICGLTRHEHDSPCVKALMTAVNHLHSAMKHDRIPV
jgi:hypothetical protein